MREIKFRVWDSEKKRYFFPIGNLSAGNEPEFEHPQIIQEFNEPESKSRWSCDLDKCFGDKGNIIQQYIGLKDKNGKEIYEGDLVDCKFTNAAPVYWDIRTASFRFGSGWTFDFEGKELEVIGNIFQHAT